MQLVVVIQLVEVIYQLLVALDGQLRLHLLHVLNLILVAPQLLFHLLHHFVSGLVPLLDVGVPAVELVGLLSHVSVQRLCLVDCILVDYQIQFGYDGAHYRV